MMALLLSLVSLITDLYIYFDLRNSLSRHKVWSRLYLAFACAGWIFLAYCLLAPRRDSDSGILFLMWGLYAYATVIIPKIIFCIFSWLGNLPRLWRRRPVKLGLSAGLPLGLIAFGAMWWGAAITRRQIDVVNVEISSPRLPAAFDGYRMVQISDLHVGTWGEDTSFVAELVDSVNAQHPDIILFTGDIVNRESTELAPFLNTLARLHAPDGVYSILGNHDYGDYVDWPSAADKRDNLQLLKNWQRQIGWKLLNNQRTQIVHDNDTIQLIGVENWGEPPFHQYGHLIDAYPLSTDSLQHLNDDRFKILLTHNPEHWRQEVRRISNIDLSLSGHTHAMQFELKFGNWRWSPSAWKYDQWGGLYDYINAKGEKLQIYVNIGAGEVGIPSRIGATPELTVITLRKAP